jgi:hypothetical protein
MIKPNQVVSSLRKIKLKQIFVSFSIALILVLAMTFNQDFANAASNQSKTTYPTDDNNMNGLLYSDSKNPESLNNVDDFVNPEERKQLLDPTQIPAKQQTAIDRSDPNAKLLEKTKQMFDDAANFSGN